MLDCRILRMEGILLDFNVLVEQLRRFAEERDWEQFHSPKNLAMALAAEAGELLELFQWLTEEQSRWVLPGTEDHNRSAEEVADILIYLLRLCDRLQIDLEQAVLDKIAINEKKYPVPESKGNATKYTRRTDPPLV